MVHVTRKVVEEVFVGCHDYVPLEHVYLDHEVVEFFLGELRFLMAGPRVLATRAPGFDTIQMIAIA